MGFESPETTEPSNASPNTLVRKVREFYLEPLTRSTAVPGEEEFLSVDDERFEVMPMHVALMRKKITYFTPL